MTESEKILKEAIERAIMDLPNPDIRTKDTIYDLQSALAKCMLGEDHPDCIVNMTTGELAEIKQRLAESAKPDWTKLEVVNLCDHPDDGVRLQVNIKGVSLASWQRARIMRQVAAGGRMEKLLRECLSGQIIFERARAILTKIDGGDGTL